MIRGTICWDVDDVLTNSMEKWLDSYYNLFFSKHPIKYKELIQNPPHEILKISKEDYLKNLDNWRLAYYNKNTVNPEIMAWFDNHGCKYHHIALTSEPIECVPIVSKWIFENLGTWIRTFSCIPSSRLNINIPVLDATKAEFCKRMNIDVFIDDMPKNYIEAKELDIKSFLVKQPWNEGQPIQDILKELTE